MSGFQVVTLDPPWWEQGGGKSKRGADRHYPLVKSPAIPGVVRSCPHWSNLADDCVMLMWVTNQFLMDGGLIMKVLGFRYVTNLVWVKPHCGLGYYFRGQHELCLMGRRGKASHIRTERRDIPSVLEAPLGRHSEKPASFHELVEQRFHGPYLEIFAREPREGWTVWGNDPAVTP